MSEHRGQSWDRLGEFTEQQRTAAGIPGVSLGVLHEGETKTTGFGVTHVDYPLPVTDETLFQIGSITKTFTGTLAMRLVEGGKLDLDATVRTYLPGFKVVDKETSARVTVRHLMTHTAGWVGDVFEDSGGGDDALARYVAAMAGIEQLAPLGKVWSYNNAGFGVLGRILEVVTGDRYADSLRTMLLEPLGMETCYFGPDEVITRRFAVGHHVAPTGAEVARPWTLPAYVDPIGGIVCHVRDLLRYARFHLGDGTAEGGERLLGQESLTQMHAPHVTVWGGEHWGLTWSVDATHSVRLVSHGGGTVGQITLLTLVPEHHFAVVVFTNADQGGTLANAVTRRSLKEYLDVEIELPKPIESSEDELTPYLGLYRRPFADLELGLLGGRLIGQLTYKKSFPTSDVPLPPPPPPMTLARCEEDRLLVLDGPFKDTTAEVIRKDDGAIGWLRANGRIHKKEG